MNGVAKDFWNEMLDTRAPVDDPRGGRRLPARRKKVRMLLTRRPTRASG